ncbi:hypothetical protein ACOMHN_033785 [Nucella lapillus]
MGKTEEYSVTIFLREYWEDKRLQWGDNSSILLTHCANNSNNKNISDINNNNNSNDRNVFNTKCNVITTTTLKDNRDQLNLGNDGNTASEGRQGEDQKDVLDRLEVDSKLLGMVWMPDLYFLNDKEAAIHDVTMANRMLHVYRNGTIRTSSRISMTLSCDMYLERYPHDEQTCSMLLGSYSYSAENVLFQWHEHPVLIREGVTLPRFEVQLSETGPCDFHFGEGSMINGNYTCIRADFKLTREFGYYIAQVYVPSCLIVSLSWVSFWIDLDAIPARVSLGLLTVLTMTTQSTGEKASLPRVSYLKAIDVWMAGCLVFVFSALLEFAYVNVQSRVEKRRRESIHPHQPKQEPSLPQDSAGGKHHGDSGIGGGGFRNGTNHTTSSDTEFKPVEDKEVELTVHTQQQHSKIQTQNLFQRCQVAKEKARMADKLSRVLFPFAFLIFNIAYWMIFVAAPL